MSEQIDAKSGSITFDPHKVSPPHLTQQSPADDSHDLRFFGKDGFTFLDFLDMVNPLHHIPIVSTLYQSITGDTIDPGAKIVGGTL